jgi:hypothetical protein
MSLLNKVKKLEQASGVGNESGVCACYGVGNIDVRLSDEGDAKKMANAARPTQLCDECGREQRIIIINLVSGPNPHATLAG